MSPPCSSGHKREEEKNQKTHFLCKPCLQCFTPGHNSLLFLILSIFR
jgi:hypothetical protein